MSMITYPLDGVTYSAADAAAWLCTRTSGVYSRDTNFALSITGAREVTLAPGLAWINYDDFAGVSVCSREAAALTVPAADSTLPRIDRVVLQFDTDANLSALKIKPGTPAAAPQPPAIVQTHRQYELGLYTIAVPAASTAVTAADITDTRTDEDVCGVMRDGVTGIPTAQLLTQWQAVQSRQEQEARASTEALVQQLQTDTGKVLDDTRQQAADLLASYTAGYLGTYTLTLAANSWQAAEGSYPLQYTVSVPLCRAVHIPVATLAPDSIAAGTAAGIAGSCETLDGSVRFFAAQRPAADLTLQLVLLGPKGDA